MKYLGESFGFAVLFMFVCMYLIPLPVSTKHKSTFAPCLKTLKLTSTEVNDFCGCFKLKAYQDQKDCAL